MIPYKLKERKYKNHPKDGHYGVVKNGTMYNGYPVTIVDDSELSKDGYSTGKAALVLIHLAEGIRSYSHLTLHEDFQYLAFGNPKNVPTYRMFDYTKRELTNDEIIQTLKKVVYDVSPQLQTQTCVGWGSGLLKDDPNRYTGTYVLNNEMEYKIEKYRDKIKFYTLLEHGTGTSVEQKQLVFEEKLNFDVYEKAVEVYSLRQNIVMFTNQALDSGIGEKIQAYEKARKELDEKLKTI